MGAIDGDLPNWIAAAVDESTGDHFHVFEVLRVTGKIGHEVVRADEADDHRTLRRTLLRKGAALPGSRDNHQNLLRDLIKGDPPEVWHFPAQVGWVDDGKAFLIGDRTIGKTAKTYRQPPWRSVQPQFGQRGTLDGWRKEVAERARYSSLMMTLTAAAFAAPLLREVNALNFMVNVFGRAKCGKSTALLAATSVFGLGTEQHLPNWNATALAIQEAGATFNDLVLPVNEVGLINGPKNQAHDSFIRPLIYAYAEGQPRRRSRAAQSAENHAATAWHGILISTAEESFTELAVKGREKRNAGEHARCHEIPAINAKRSTVIDHWPPEILKANRKAWAIKVVQEIRVACEQQHGTAIGPFIEFLMKLSSAERRERIDAKIEAFLTKVSAKDQTPEIAHAARNFGLTYAGGALAIKAGVLPWSRSDLLKAVAKCFRAAHPGAVNVLPAAKRKLREHLTSSLVHAKPKGKATTPGEKCAGYRDLDGNVFKIHAKSFKNWFSGLELKAILSWLQEKGHLKLPKGTEKHNSKGTGWTESTVKWPDDKTHRTIIFSYPLKNLTIKVKNI